MTPEETDTPPELAALQHADTLAIDGAPEVVQRVPETAPLRMECAVPAYIGFRTGMGSLPQIAAVAAPELTAPVLTAPVPLSRVEVRHFTVAAPELASPGSLRCVEVRHFTVSAPELTPPAPLTRVEVRH
jgi:hypothetical protein